MDNLRKKKHLYQNLHIIPTVTVNNTKYMADISKKNNMHVNKSLLPSVKVTIKRKSKESAIKHIPSW